MSGHYFVTTPIYYANAEPHIGHTYTTVLVDMLVRWHRLRGESTFSVSGTDEHGEKMVEAAAARGLPPNVFTEQVSATHQRTWRELGLSVDRFVRTTDPAHVRNVSAILQRVYDAGWIELREYEGLYCVGCERFLTERDLVDGLCRDHERRPEVRRETNYFFLMSREFGWLRRRIDENPDWIRPARFRNEALAMLRDESGLGDLSISRPKDRLDWGIELPFDRDHVCYVWFDALISYLTGAGYDASASRQSPEFEARWASSEHLIGKDILKPHAIFWPIMLKAIGLEPYQHLSVHGFWNVDDRKISKSLGNMVSPLAMSDRYGFEAFRWFLLREISFGLDADFSEAALIERVNADLANNVGNLASRTLNLVERFADGAVPEPGDGDPAFAEVVSLGTVARVEAALEQLQPHVALAAVLELASAVNRYLDTRAPWKLAKDPETRPLALAALYHTANALRVLALLLSPFVPAAARSLAERLGEPDLAERADWPAEAADFSRLPAGRRIERGAPLFPRLEPPGSDA
jgi:methionyl-tRNA synthetase